MLGVIDMIYLGFAFISLYFMLLFINIYFTKKKTAPLKAVYKKISFIIPAHNEEKVVKGTIDAIKNTKYPERLKEIIVIDDGSTDNTKKIAKSCNVRVYSKKRGGKAAAFNYGLRRATGSIIACVDADSYPTEDSIFNAMKYFSDPQVGSVTTSILVKNKKNILSRLQEFEYIMIAWVRKNLEFIEGIYVTPGPLSFYRKDILLKLKGFDEKNLTEDIEMTWRMQKNGYKIRMASDATTLTVVPTKLKNWWKQRIRWNIGGLQTLNKYKSDTLKKNLGSLGTFIIPFFTLSLFVSLLGLGIFSYLISNWAINYILFVSGTYGAGANPLTNFELLFLPTIFTIFGVTIALLSIFYMKINLRFYNRKFRKKIDYIILLLYITFYISIFPVILIHSISKIIRGKKEW